MFGRKIPLFRIFGVEIAIDSSWFLLAVLIIWSLSVGFFPFHYPGLNPNYYWLMGVLGAIGLFISILFHELAHSMVARSYGLTIHGITLFLFGGIAQMEMEPQNPKVEFQTAVVGPILSLILGASIGGFYFLGKSLHWPIPITGTLWYLATVNVSLAAFNLIPAFPLDGGRIFRALIWKLKGNLIQATRIATLGGKWCGTVLICLGIILFISGNFITGMWWALIGLFLRSAAIFSLQEAIANVMLEGEKIERFMTKKPISIPASISIKEFVDKYLYDSHHKVYPVESGPFLVGYLSLEALNTFPTSEWQHHKIIEVMTPCSLENTIPPQTPAEKVLKLMATTGKSRWLIAQDGKLLGIVSIKDMVDIIALKLTFTHQG